MRTFSRRNALAASAVVAVLSLGALGLSACKGGKGGAASDISQDMTLGKADAPVTVIEYASVTCPHCAHFNAEVFPAFKAKYVDTGKVKYVFRETNIHGAADVAGYLLARCVGKEKYFSVVDAIMRSQPELGMQLENTHDVYQNIARSSGLTDEQFNACLSDPKQIEALNTRMAKEADEFKVQGTPTFVVNGKKMNADRPPTLEELSAEIDPLLKK